MTTHANWAAAPAAMLRHRAVAPALFEPRSEPPPPGPDRETDADFQRRVDELLGYTVPWWRDAAVYLALTGLVCLAFSAFLLAMA